MIADAHLGNEILVAEDDRARATLDAIGDGVISTDPAGNVTYLNRVAERMTGWSCEEATGRSLVHVFNVVDGLTREPVSDRLALAIHRDKSVGLARNTVLIGRDGIELAIEDCIAPIHDRQARITGAVIVFRDTTTARALEQVLSLRAQHDVLTDLPNRSLLSDRLDQAIAQARRHGTGVAVLFIDLDRFKDVNDALGHAVGDRLLQEVARRLKATVRASDTVSRLGGDEFVVVLSEIEHRQNAAMQAEKIRAALAAPPHAIGRQKLRIEASIGTSVFPDDGLDATTLINRADMAMYAAKRSGRNRHRFFAPDAGLRAIEGKGPIDDARCERERRDLPLHQKLKAHSNVEESVR